MRLIDADALANYANNQIVGITANDIMRFPTVDAEPVRHTTNISKIADCDEFICNDCGLHLKDWVRVEITDEYGEDHYEYEFEFCPSCGAKIIIEDMDIKPAAKMSDTPAEQLGLAPAT